MKYIYRICIPLIVVFFISSSHLYSQTDEDKFLKQASVDFAVPDAPAFQIIQADPTSILRPSSVREVAVTLGNTLTSGTIPDNYALELSPGLIFGKSLQAYKKNPFLYRARISVATKSGEDESRQVGAGLRFTLWDETDLRTNADLEKELIKIGNESNNLKVECVNELSQQGINPDNPDYEKLLNECLEKKNFDNLSGAIEKQREIAKKKSWNAINVEAGFALSANSHDTLASNLVAQNYQWWFSGAFPLGEDGQILVGLNGGVNRNEDGELKNTSSNLGLRGYYGDNTQKVFVEGDLKTSSGVAPFLSFNLGYEYNLLNGLWADISLGVIKKEEGKFVSHSTLNFRFATPE